MHTTYLTFLWCHSAGQVSKPSMQLAPRPNSGWSTAGAAGAKVPSGTMTLGLRRFALEQPSPSHSDLTGKARIFLDSGRVEDYAQILPLGICWGVTTNPTILQRSNVPCTCKAIKDLAAAAFSFGAQEFMAQTWGGDIGTLVEHGLQIASIDPRVVVKVPVTAAGLEAATLLRAQGMRQHVAVLDCILECTPLEPSVRVAGVRICTTAVYSSHQVVSSIAVGAEYAGMLFRK